MKREERKRHQGETEEHINPTLTRLTLVPPYTEPAPSSYTVHFHPSFYKLKLCYNVTCNESEQVANALLSAIANLSFQFELLGADVVTIFFAGHELDSLEVGLAPFNIPSLNS